MEELLARAWDVLVGREHGPLHWRLVVQPMMAGLLAFRAGWRDARDGRPAFGWAVASDSSGRRALLREGWNDVAGLFLMAFVLDSLYQIIVFHWLYIVQALLVAAIVALPTYLLIRGPTNRIARLWLGKT